ncbi:unnamed protein product [Musa banksii]
MKSQNRCSNPNGVHFCHHPTHPTLGSSQVNFTYSWVRWACSSFSVINERGTSQCLLIDQKHANQMDSRLLDLLRWYILQNVSKKLTLQLLFIILSAIQRQILVEEFPDIGSRFL